MSRVEPRARLMSRAEPRALLHEEFFRQVEATPRRAALIEGDRSVSFEELGLRVDRLASGLAGAGVGAGSMVGLHVERSIDWVACALAILKVNGAVVPLPPSYPRDRLRGILEHVQPDATVSAEGSSLDPSAPGRWLALRELPWGPPGGAASSGPGSGARGFSGPESSVPGLPESGPSGSGFSHPGSGAPDPRSPESGHAHPGPGDPRQPAFVLCSSGSTGRPKLIVRSHRSFFHRLTWTWERHPYAEDERCCQKSHMTTTHAVYELFEPLLRGVPVLIVPDRDVRDLDRFWGVLEARRISRLLAVPSQLEASLAIPGFVPPPLRVLVLMGEYVSPALAERTLAAFSERTSIYSIYGSTEASSTIVCDLRESFRPGQELPLGRPIAADIRAVVLNGEGKPAAPGEAGRLHIAGPALFEGYLRDPELTASVLVDGSGADAPWYDTRDEVRLTADGELEFVGRADSILKVRGFRVDPKEVEEALLEAPGVRQAAVVGSGGGHRSHRVVAFVAPASVDRAGVFDALRSRLPDYMLPSHLTALDALPLTPSGKVDRRRLQEEATGRSAGLPASGEPQDRPAPGEPPDRPAPGEPLDRSAPGQPPVRSARSEPPVRPAPPSTHPEPGETEREVEGAWERVLGEGGHPLDVSFFEAGGTSLSAFALVHQLRERFELDPRQLDVETVYESPTIEELAARIEAARGGDAPGTGSRSSVLLTLRRGRDPALAPVFFVAPAGGTLGSYGKLARALDTPRELIGVRDPFNWGERDPALGFEHWTGLYVEAIRERQPAGPYHVVAYSSGAPFGYEIARRLRAAGESVALLALVDPLGLDSGGRSRYGWWVLKAAMGRPLARTLIRLMGRFRLVPLSRIPGLRARLARPTPAITREEVHDLIRRSRADRRHILSLSGLLELNTGIPYALAPGALDGVAPETFISVLKERVAALTPEVDLEVVERVVDQYPLQVRAQELYRLEPYDGEVLLVEASAPYTGLVRAQLAPYVKRLRRRVVELGAPSDRVRKVAERWGPTALHFRTMRDDHFVEGLARELDAALEK